MDELKFEHLAVAMCRHGWMVWPKSDATIGRSLGLYGEFAEGENRVMARYLRSGDVALDIGANLGTTALPMARAVGNAGQVLAFEPQSLMAQCLQATLTLNEIFNVRLLTSAVGAHSGVARLPMPGVLEGGNYGAMALADVGLPVPLMCLDDFPINQCDFVKIDVEGDEWAVIQGACATLLQHKPVMYIEAKRQLPQTRDWLAWLLDHGWRCYWHFAFFFQSDNHRANSVNVFGGTGDMNVLAVPSGRVQPDDLPEIQSAEEDWQAVYAPFFESRGLAMP